MVASSVLSSPHEQLWRLICAKTGVPLPGPDAAAWAVAQPARKIDLPPWLL